MAKLLEAMVFHVDHLFQTSQAYMRPRVSRLACGIFKKTAVNHVDLSATVQNAEESQWNLI